MTKTILGIVGFKGSGKDTLGNLLVENFNFSKDSFASTLKDACSCLFNWPRHLLEGDTKESREFREIPDTWWAEKLGKPGFTPRQALMEIGTEVMRYNFHPDMWLLGVERKFLNSDKNFVITDCRFPNEIQSIRRLGGKIIRIRRGDEPDWYQTAEAANSDFTHADICVRALNDLGIHPSEWSWIGTNFDYIVENNGTIEDLKCRVQVLMESLNLTK